MSRKIRMRDVSEAASWHFGAELDSRPATRRVIAARRCAYKVCRELGFTWGEIGEGFNRERTTIISALSNGHSVDPDDAAAVLANARARALADSEQLA